MTTRRYVLLASLCLLIGAWMLWAGVETATSEPVLAQAQPTATRPPVPPLATATSVPPPVNPPESAPEMSTPTPTVVPLMPEAGGSDVPLVAFVLLVGMLMVAAVWAVGETRRPR